MTQAATNPRAVVLLSGGLDSTTCLAMARAQGYECLALTVLYGQRHRVEIQAARRVAQALGAARHLEIVVDLGAFGGSALTADIEVPKGRSEADISGGIPITYVPARNTVFLSLALAWAEALDCTELFIGVNALDYSGYPDCRPEFIMAFENLANMATKMATAQGRRIRVHAPLIRMSKAQIIKAGLELGVDYGLTHSCYDPTPDGRPCEQCDSCLLRAKGFAEAGVADPVFSK
ncbi:MAG: 7-cyano-7-deazaguanine synthase QueC [Proteobacteria bacterium]|nr:7-cyano-7-deazaguanine synthase QueC [Pseudomonadota bacterium]MBU1452008.1 7-cyano-7-deazaguanine synthase QueC [Pseudomonadota bacterium]MBU2470515.1 7-cyano-7-deazaguanine synthase QueC [Pseudomonadota bacterium]MBU2516016.1 7-cyano-7-deazaguanine synthase QueC [Pseudomonadota bacterium]